MIKTLIVDDEFLIRKQLLDSIAWSALGLKVVGEASDGETALEKVHEFQPDLLILDINIPIISGLELAEILKQNYPWTNIIILTAYENFDYARRAISAGVVYYYVKPIDIDEFTQILIKIKEEIEEAREERWYIGKLEKQIEDNAEGLKNEFLRNLLIRSYIERDIEEKFISFGLSHITRPVKIALIELDRFYERWPNKKEQQLWYYAVLNIASEIFSEKGRGICFQGDENEIAVIASDSPPIVELCKEISYLTKKFLNLSITAGVSNCHKNYSEIYLAFKEARLALEEKFIHGNDSIIEYQPRQKPMELENLSTLNDQRDLLKHLRNNDEKALIEEIEYTYLNVINKRFSNEYIRSLFTNLVYTLIKFLVEKNIPVYEILNNNQDFTYYIKTRETAEEIKDWVISIYKKTIFICQEDKNLKISPISLNARKYIETHFEDENLSLYSVSQNIFISPTHLSKVFKKDYNQSISSYIIELRLKKAKEIIDKEHVGIKIMDLAKRCGYKDPFYFSKSFKREYGVSPSDYIRNKVKR